MFAFKETELISRAKRALTKAEAVIERLPHPLVNFVSRDFSASLSFFAEGLHLRRLPIEPFKAYGTVYQGMETLNRWLESQPEIPRRLLSESRRLPEYINANFLVIAIDTLEILRYPAPTLPEGIIFQEPEIPKDLQQLIEDKSQGTVISTLHGAEMTAMEALARLFKERKIYAFMELQDPETQKLLNAKMAQLNITPITVNQENVDTKLLVNVVKALRESGVVITHIDRPPKEGEGMEVDFLGQKAYFSKVALSSLGRLAPTVPVIAVKTADQKYTVLIGNIIPVGQKGQEETFARNVLQEFEKLILKHLLLHSPKNFSIFSFFENLWQSP